MEKPKRQKTGGREKGTPNKMNKELKDMILTALDKSGGEKYLITQARDNPTAFLTLLGKVLPKDVHQTTTHKGEINLKSMSDDDLSYAIGEMHKQYESIRQALN